MEDLQKIIEDISEVVQMTLPNITADQKVAEEIVIVRISHKSHVINMKRIIGYSIA
jgi:hypothetical protein